MTASKCPNSSSPIVVRPLQHRDVDALQQLSEMPLIESQPYSATIQFTFRPWRWWYQVWQFCRWLPSFWRDRFGLYVAEIAGQVLGMIQVTPVNRTRSTWCVERLLVTGQQNGDPANDVSVLASSSEIGSHLLRYCLQSILEARMWLLEVDIHDKNALALYRLNGFQILARMTYWEIAPAQLGKLASHEPSLPNLLPVSNADAQLLYQLDTAAMPPLIRQVFDRHVHDFRTSLGSALLQSLQQWLQQTEVVSAYVFESQRKAAIGYFQLRLSRDESEPHQAQLTVHPAYTWLYDELLAQMARVAQTYPNQPMQLVSADYQPEREAHLEQIGAVRLSQTLMMSRSIWHKVSESKLVSLDTLQLSEMLQGLQPTQKPVPGRIVAHDLDSQSASDPTSPDSNVFYFSTRTRYW
jgi:hypothetical protein